MLSHNKSLCKCFSLFFRSKFYWNIMLLLKNLTKGELISESNVPQSVSREVGLQGSEARPHHSQNCLEMLFT